MSASLQNFLGPELNALYADGEKLTASAGGGFHDYSFIVFPFAKIYEGFLKKLFLHLGAITEKQYNSDHWRVGKALNPQLETDLRHESVYDRLDLDLATILWDTWKEGRNKVFHYFPQTHRGLSFSEAQGTIGKINQAMEMALKKCKIASDGSNTNGPEFLRRD